MEKNVCVKEFLSALEYRVDIPIWMGPKYFFFRPVFSGPFIAVKSLLTVNGLVKY